jgi:hypothetical protein
VASGGEAFVQGVGAGLPPAWPLGSHPDSALRSGVERTALEASKVSGVRHEGVLRRSRGRPRLLLLRMRRNRCSP